MPLVRATIIGTFACLAGAWLTALCIHRHSKTAGGGLDAFASKGIGTVATAPGPTVPKQIQISMAQLSDVPSDAPPAGENGHQQPAIAQVGSLDSVPSSAAPAAARAGKTEEDQSDAELGGTDTEPTHTVAPVPVQDESQAAVNVALAPVGASAPLKPAPVAMIHGSGRALAVRIALVVRPGVRRADRRIGDLRDQMRVANSQPTVFVPSASFAVPADPHDSEMAEDSVPRDWPLADESPIADPAFLIAKLGPHDPLRTIAQRWELDAGPASAASASPDVDRAVADSTQPWQILYEMGRDSAFFETASLQRDFWRAAVARAAASPLNQRVSRHDLRSMQVLAGTFLWVWKDDAAAAEALRTLLKWQKHNSAVAGQAALLLTTLLDRQANG